MTKALLQPTAELAAPAVDFTSSLFDFSTVAAMAAAITDAQRQQWQAFMTWQNSMAEWQREFWDQWVSHWGGGVPIDG